MWVSFIIAFNLILIHFTNFICWKTEFSELTLTTLWANSADDKLVIVFLFFPENRIWHFMQIV